MLCINIMICADTLCATLVLKLECFWWIQHSLFAIN